MLLSNRIRDANAFIIAIKNIDFATPNPGIMQATAVR